MGSVATVQLPAWTLRFVHPSLEGRDRTRAQLAVLIAFASAFTLLALAVALQALQPRGWTAPMMTGLIVCNLFSVAVVRHTGHVPLAAHLQLGALLLAGVVFCAPIGGVAFPAASSFLLIPPLSLLLIDRAAARAWTFLAVAALFGLTFFPAPGVFAPDTVSSLLPLAQLDVMGRGFFTASLQSILVVGWFMMDLSESLRIQHEQMLVQAVADLEVARDDAEAANRAKSQFLANMSHEIRTPLNGVLGVAENLLLAPLSEDHLAQVRLLHRAGKNLKGIVDDLLDLARAEAGQFSLEAVPTSLAEVIDDVVEVHRYRAEEKGLTLTTHVDPRAPVGVLADPLRLRQVLHNLVSNAIKFTEHGAIEVHVALRGPQLADGRVPLEIAVADSGIGIPSHALPNLFQKFQQADLSASRRYGGAGLGLAISKEIVDLLGGTIHVETCLSVGTTMRVHLDLPPAHLASTDPRGSFVSHVDTSPQADGVRARRVLLVEDNPINQAVAVRLLSSLGVEVTVADGGEPAVELVSQNRYDLVLMDLQMPGMDGLTATRILRTLPQAQRLPIVALTANAYPEDRKACEEAGMNDHLAKPVSLNALRETLDRWCPKAQTRPEPRRHLRTIPGGLSVG